jgi:TolB-like protein
LRTRALQAALTLSERAQASGDRVNATEWARRAVALAPFDEPAVRRLISALDDNGDRAGALRAYDELRTRLQVELDAEPAAETDALAMSIRDRVTSASVPAAPRPALDAPPAPPAPPALPAAPVAARARARPAIIAVGVVAVVGLAVTALSRALKSDQVGGATATVAVLPFEVSGDSSAQYLGGGMVSLLAERFNQDGQLQALDARSVLRAADGAAVDDVTRARAVLARIRPRFVVLGSIEAARDSITLSASLFDSVRVRTGAVRASVSGPARDAARLADALAEQLIVALPENRAPLTRGPYNTLTSLDALKHFLAADKAYAAGKFQDATASYRAAVQADTTFALAYLWLSRSAQWAGDHETAAWALSRAFHYSEKLALLDQYRLRAWDAYQGGQVTRAERLYQVVLANDVAAGDAWQAIGELRFHWGPLIGWTMPEARDAFERAVTVSAGDVGSWLHLARIAVTDDRMATLDSITRTVSVRGLDELQALELSGLRAYSRADAAEQARIGQRVAELPDGDAFAAVTTIIAATAQHPHAYDLTGALTRPGRSSAMRASGAILAAQMAAVRGRWRDADAALQRAELPAMRAVEYRAALAALPFNNADTVTLRALQRALAAPVAPLVGPWIDFYGTSGIFEPRQLYLRAMIANKLGDSAAVQRALEQMKNVGGDATQRAYAADAARLVRAVLLHGRGQHAQALAELGEPDVLPDRVLPGVLSYMSAHERFLRAELLRELKQYPAALRWLRTFPDPAAYDLMYLAPVHYRIAAIQRELGDSRSSAAHLRTADRVWAHADSHLKAGN